MRELLHIVGYGLAFLAWLCLSACDTVSYAEPPQNFKAERRFLVPEAIPCPPPNVEIRWAHHAEYVDGVIGQKAVCRGAGHTFTDDCCLSRHGRPGAHYRPSEAAK